jgi:hypothetical protein
MRIETPGPPVVRFSSQDLLESELDEREEEGLPMLVLYADLPVKLDFLGRPEAAFASPFIEMTSLWGERAGEYSSRSNTLYELRQTIFPAIRRAASLYQLNDLERLEAAVARFPLDEIEGLGELHSIYKLGRLIDFPYTPFIDVLQRTAAVNELLVRMVVCHRQRRHDYRRLLDEMVHELGFLEHRRKVVETGMNVIEHADALLPGLAWEHISTDPRPDPNDYRIVRGDFDELRARYVEIFELASRTLAYTGAIVNLAERAAPDLWSNGARTSARTMLRGRTAHQREFILDELPYAKTLYDEVHRQSRNDFGHYAIEYDFASGELVDHDGTRTSYLLFLVDYLAAARLTSYLLGVVEKISLDYLDAPSEHRRVAAAEEAAIAPRP